MVMHLIATYCIHKRVEIRLNGHRGGRCCRGNGILMHVMLRLDFEMLKE
jgi:hypothetical protein